MLGGRHARSWQLVLGILATVPGLVDVAQRMRQIVLPQFAVLVVRAIKLLLAARCFCAASFMRGVY